VGLFDGDARLQARDHAVRGRIAPPRRQRIDLEGHPRGFSERKAEIRRHDADDGARRAVDAKRCADDIPGAAIALLPDVVAEEDDGGGAGSIVPLTEAAPEDGFDAQRAVGGHGELAAAQSLGTFIFRGDIERREAERTKLFEGCLARLDDRDIRNAQRLLALVLVGAAPHHRHNPVRIGERQPFEHGAVDDGKHGRAQADPDPERQDGDARERRIHQQHPDPRAEVPPPFAHT
jgi:hypothetical protein